jgi:hypothetical protein
LLVAVAMDVEVMEEAVLPEAQVFKLYPMKIFDSLCEGLFLDWCMWILQIESEDSSFQV